MCVNIKYSYFDDENSLDTFLWIWSIKPPIAAKGSKSKPQPQLLTLECSSGDVKGSWVGLAESVFVVDIIVSKKKKTN